MDAYFFSFAGKSLVRNSGVGGGGQSLILIDFLRRKIRPKVPLKIKKAQASLGGQVWFQNLNISPVL